MSGSPITDIRQQAIAKYRTGNQRYKHLPVGTRVKVIVPMRDFAFFNNETGEVVENKERYLGIIVRFDKRFNLADWNFLPEDLYILGEAVRVRAK